VLALVSLAACTPAPIPAQPPVQREQHAALEAAAHQDVTCTAGADCDEKWMRAEVWVKKNSSYSLKQDSDSIIETAGPITPTTDSAFTVTKTTDDKKTYTIHFTSSCGPNACVPTSLELKASFKKFVMYGF
jgi:hypothetical protein